MTVSAAAPLRSRRLQELWALEQAAQAKHRPGFCAASKRARQIALAARDGRRGGAGKFTVRKTSKSQYLIDQQARRHLTMVRNDHARTAADVRHATAEECSQVDDRKQLASHVGHTANPRLGARH